MKFHLPARQINRDSRQPTADSSQREIDSEKVRERRRQFVWVYEAKCNQTILNNENIIIINTTCLTRLATHIFFPNAISSEIYEKFI